MNECMHNVKWNNNKIDNIEIFNMDVSKSVSQNNGKARQFIAAVIVNLASLSYGISIGWTSPIIPQLRSNHPPIGDKPMTTDQEPWISSFLLISGLLTTPFPGILADRFGRKKFAQLTALPFVVSWLLTIFAQNVIHLYAARIFAGMGGAMMLFVVPVYISEIASEDIRGLLGSLLVFSLNIGILFAFVVGAFLSYRLFAILSLLFPVAFAVATVFLPETPVYLVRRNRQLQAHKSLMFFRGNNQLLADQELTKLQSQTKSSEASSKSIKFSEFFKDRATRKGLIISFGLMAGQQLSGIFAMMSYAETIFKQAGSSLSAETSSIIIAVIQIVGSYASTMLMERAGRRLLTLVSCLGMTISHGIVGLFFYLQQNNHDVSSISWLPVVALSAYIISFCLGIGPVPFVVVSEVFRADISSFAHNLCSTFLWAVALAAVYIFTAATQIFGVGGCFLMLASFCGISFVFCYCLLPETKGRKREDIIDELAGGSKCDKCEVAKSAESNGLMNSDSI